jgi:hypothetical protein
MRNTLRQFQRAAPLLQLLSSRCLDEVVAEIVHYGEPPPKALPLEDFLRRPVSRHADPL